VWTTTERRGMRVNEPDGSQTSSGDWVQVSRLGNPLVNEVVIPAGLKDAFNALEPKNDADVKAAVDRVLDPELARLIEAIYDIPAPKTPRDDLVAVYLTGIEGLNKPMAKNQRPAEMLRLNTSTAVTAKPNRLGVLGGDNQGFPNGRRLADDVIDISVQAVEGAVRSGIVDALAKGDKVNHNDKDFSKSFPYVALPHPGSDAAVHGDRSDDDDDDNNNSAAAAVSGPASSTPTWPYAAALGGVGLLAFAAGLALRLRGRRTPRIRPASTLTA